MQSPLGEQSDMLLLNNEWAEKLLEDYTSYPASETVKLKHGYLYLLEDTSYPEYIKLGMTRDLKRRYQEYNQHKPYNTADHTLKEKCLRCSKRESCLLPLEMNGLK